jgi:hypothetical protein
MLYENGQIRSIGQQQFCSKFQEALTGPAGFWLYKSGQTRSIGQQQFWSKSQEVLTGPAGFWPDPVDRTAAILFQVLGGRH